MNYEKKWQEKWQQDNVYKFDDKNLDNKYYLLEMFSYPSGANLHLGHWFNYSLSDSFGRFKRMQGYNLFHPVGFDAFGLPAENYALKTGIHPSISTEKNIFIMERQLKEMGTTVNWDCEIATCRPDYYKWTQWLFLQLYKHGLAYQKYAPVNWCNSCNTVLANEQVIDGKCERCSTEVIKKNMTQWFFKITDYCEELLDGLNKIDWPEKTKLAQKNWIGKSVGAEVDFKCENGTILTVFTSRVDTLYGVSWLVLAPENENVLTLTTPENKEAIKKYIYETSKKDDITRQGNTEKTGVFTGSYAINPVNNKRVPIYIGDYVLNTYATGIVMGVAAHDERDYEFAVKHGIHFEPVIQGKNNTLPYCQDGILINSDIYNGLTSNQAREKIVEDLEKLGIARKKINYKLRDWSVSRQRYWGCPIPIIHCPHCGTVPVPEKDLPVLLPETMDYKPDGRSPLERISSFVDCKCPVCGQDAKRDSDTLDTFVCSSWYFLRYPNSTLSDKPFDTEYTNKILPVDKYVGGMEHATGHLLYSRFITKFLNKLGLINFDEPFKSLVHQGMILGTDAKKMSKSRGNTVNLDGLIAENGSDALRLYLAFGFNYLEGGPWNNAGIKSIVKFMERIERLVTEFSNDNHHNKYLSEEKELDYWINFAVKNATQSMEEFGFNTAVARIMELVNAVYKYQSITDQNKDIVKKAIETILILISPFTPHFAEEMWEKLGNKYSIHNQTFPICDESKLVKDEIEIVVQINSKIVCKLNIPANASNEQIQSLALSQIKIQNAMQGKNLVKSIVIPSRLINLIVK